MNTIVLAYAGASLPLLLVITAGTQPVKELLTSEFLAREILRSAVGTIGLVASVPITTALAALVADLQTPAAPTPPRVLTPAGTDPPQPATARQSIGARSSGRRPSTR